MSNVIIKVIIKERKTSKLTERKSGMVNKLNPKKGHKNGTENRWEINSKNGRLNPTIMIIPLK